MSNPLSLTAYSAALVLIAGGGAPPLQPAPWSAAMQEVVTPAAQNSAQPQLSASRRGVVLSWIETSAERATLKYAEWTPGGWSAARTVASGTDWFVNWADVPSVVRLADGTLAAHWLQKSGADTYAYDVRLSYSRDDGKTWAASFLPHRDGTKTEHGFASLFQMPGSGLGVVWLDGRATAGQGAHAEHERGGAMSLRFAAFDPGWKETRELALDSRVCDCCPTTAALTDDGPIVAFRNRSDEEVRDIYVARYEQGRWTEPTAVYHDDWKIQACPVNGPMLSARGRQVAIAWFTMKEDQGHAFVTFSDDAGRTFGTPIRVDERAALGRVDVELLGDGSAVASWLEFADQQTTFRLRRVERSGATSPVVTVAALASSRASGYPRIAVHNQDLLLAWTEAGQLATRVKTASIRLNVPASAPTSRH